MDKLTVLSLEQALSLSHGTQRFVHLGWRVIRIEATPSGTRLPGDPNRYVGKEGDQPDLHAYFVGPNAGKEAIALNLKEPKGRVVLKRLIAELPVDIFACNTLPARYKALGIDYETLCAVRPELIWVGLSALGPDYPNVPGYDPALQALTGYMDLTGDPDGPPMLCGVPFVDLKAGDEVFANVCLALAERAETGRGQRIDISMAQAAASWLLTTIPLLDLGYGPDEIRRSGNEHREFVPVNVYPTLDGFIYLAVGNDVQWSRLISMAAFSGLDSPGRRTNDGRRRERVAIHRDIGSITRMHKTNELMELFRARGLAAAPIRSVSEAIAAPPLQGALLETTTASGRHVRLPPPAVESPHFSCPHRRLAAAPGYDQDTRKVLAEAGFRNEEITGFKESGIIP